MRTESWWMKRGPSFVLAALLAMGFCAPLPAQQFAVGADVSFLASAEQQGIVFKEDGAPKPVLEILKDHGFNWIRLRIFVHPTDLPNDLDYTVALAKRARLLGFHILLDFHYSDTWADPSKQFIPAKWKSLKHTQLVEQVFTYTRETIVAFRNAGVMPDMVQTGNEITNGMLWPDGKLPDNWDRFADLLRAAISGVDTGRGSFPRPVIMIHIERSGEPKEAIAFFDKLLTYDLRWNVIGLSYYPRWHGTIAQLRQTLHDLSFRYVRPIIVVETAYNWTPGDFIGKKADFPESPEGQKRFLQAVDKAVRETPRGLGRGVFWWEPAVADGPIAGRALFDDKHNALPAITAFDNDTRIQAQ
ncbi:MAG: glycosyl hydrolase 53 family protein [Terracidiphilus sp.]|jgi:arabinogalactan endo-1,4-beta-galactosidase